VALELESDIELEIKINEEEKRELFALFETGGLVEVRGVLANASLLELVSVNRI
jgi:hypothetical protein